MSNEIRPRYISATGPDGAGKDTAWRTALPQLPPELRILKIGKPSSVIIDGIEEPIQTRISHQLDILHSIADKTRNRALTSLVNATYVMFQWRYQEPYWSNKVKPDIVFSLRDGYIDPAAYAPFYMTSTLGKMCIKDRVNILKFLHRSPFRDKTMFMDICPAEAMQRIDERMARENTISGLTRPHWVHQHETLEGLSLIRDEFFKVMQYLRDHCGTEFVVIDTSVDKGTVGYNLAQFITNG